MKLPIHIAFGILIAASAACAQAPLASNQGPLTWAADAASDEGQMARARRRLVQFCVPAEDDFDAPRVYCGSGPG